MTKIASVCMVADPRDKEANLAKMIGFIEEATGMGVDLLVMPEMCLPGYGTAGMQQFSGEDKMAFFEYAEVVPEGDTTKMVAELAKKAGMHICWGMTEKDVERFDAIYNTVVLVGPDGYIGKYRKTHQPLCERLELYPGSGDYPVFDTKIGKIGLEVCYDKCFPEVARTLALKGAQIIVNPTAWPNMSGKPDDPDQIVYETFGLARAMENMVFLVDSNQCGQCFAGQSRVIGPNPGQVLATTGFDEGMAVADVDIEAEILHARTFAMGGSDLLKDRKPGTYGMVAKDNPYSPTYGGRIEE